MIYGPKATLPQNPSFIETLDDILTLIRGFQNLSPGTCKDTPVAQLEKHFPKSLEIIYCGESPRWHITI